MKTWFKRARGAVGTGLTWAAAWAVAGVLIGVSSNLLPGLPWDAFFAVFDAPLPTLAIPGFVGGALFSVVLGVAGRRHRFDELSLPLMAAWGATGGLLLSLVPVALSSVGLLSGDGAHSLWQTTAVISGPFTLLSALSAAGSLVLARRAEHRQPFATGEEIAELALTGSEARVLLGDGNAALHGHPAARPGARVRPESAHERNARAERDS